FPEMYQEPPLVSFSLTHVEFDPTDPLAFLFAFITLSPLALIVSYVTIILARREMVAINMFFGQLICEGLNFLLKRLIKEKRPEKLGKGYGMPSSHAQFMAYFTTFSILYLYTRITFGRNSQKFPICIVNLLSQHSHSTTFFPPFTQNLPQLSHPKTSNGLFRYILDSQLARYFYLRDSSDIEDIVKIEYMNWLELNKRNGIKEANKKDR
ncbi:18905_t:CDS:2, partial [Acaulospora morrowiae]